MHPNMQKEQFSRAYVHAVATVAGYSAVAKPDPDDDSVDLIVCARGPYETKHSPRLEAQLKCTGRSDTRGDFLSLPISRKNYDGLRIPSRAVDIILVVMEVPTELAYWLKQSEDEMLTRHCSYWLSLRGAPALPLDQQEKTVRLPRAQLFDVAQLQAIMARIGRGDRP